MHHVSGPAYWLFSLSLQPLGDSDAYVALNEMQALSGLPGNDLMANAP